MNWPFSSFCLFNNFFLLITIIANPTEGLSRGTAWSTIQTSHILSSQSPNKYYYCHYFIDEELLSEVAQSCLILCDPMDCSLPGSSVRGIFQTRVWEWVAISFSTGSSQLRVKPRSAASQADALPFEPPGKPQMKKLRPK